MPGFRPTKVLDIELSQPIVTLEGLGNYGSLQILVRLHGTPIGYVKLPLAEDCCLASSLTEAIVEQQSEAIIRHLVCDALAMSAQPNRWRINDLLQVPHPLYRGPFPSVTVAVCTRDRTDDLARCLDSLRQLDYPSLDFIVVDNAPASDKTERMVKARYPDFRYVCEPRPGLDWARNRAIRAAQGEIIAFTDDDVVVDPGWIKALAALFAEHPEVMLVTGLVVPYELETEAQVLFEQYGGFGRGFERKWARVDRERDGPFKYYATGQFGTGANMAYRRCVFAQIGDFDPALDVGTVTNGGGDLEMFFRVLKEGHPLVYEPSAIVRHRHRREQAQLRAQIANNGVAFDSYIIRSALAYPDERVPFVRFWLRWLWRRYLRGLMRSSSLSEKALLFSEMLRFLSSLDRYHRARRTAAGFAATSSPRPLANISPSSVKLRHDLPQKASAVRMVELSEPLQTLSDVMDYPIVRVFVCWKGHPLGGVNITNCYKPIAPDRLRESIVRCLSFQILEPDQRMDLKTLTTKVKATLAQHYLPSEGSAACSPSDIRAELGVSPTVIDVPLSADISVSVIVATRDRPNDLRNCLRSLMAQVSPRRIEIVVVDNNPISGLTAPILAEFPQTVIVNESRQGLAYARNAGFSASTGEILVTTDDDVIAPQDWIEKLLEPFGRAEVMIVTGNVLPLELESNAQCLFEIYGGLGRGFERREFGASWFASAKYSGVPTWKLGCTANAAFRASIFESPDIGLMNEALGPGMPSGVGEDTYLFYKALKAGHTVVYEPAAYIWHRHRREVSALRHQLYGYSKGHVAYHLTTLLSDHDLRGLIHVMLRLPLYHLRRIRACLRPWNNYPLSLVMLEIAGNLVGPLALWRSRRRVQREGRSSPYVPVAQRSKGDC